jgi:hypothetical protein
MADPLSLFKSFAAGMVDYIARHNGNYALIETVLNQILGQLTGQAGGLAVPSGLQEIFDRRGLIGVGSYDFNTGGLSGPDYNLTVQAGAYYNAGTFYHKPGTSSLAMAGKASGTYYVNLDAAGNPLVASSPDATTTRQFSWDSGSHTISAKAIYAGVNILFDGDDYADLLTSAARAKSFTKVADRLEEIEVLLSKAVQTPASADTVNINWSLGGLARVMLDRPTTTINMSGAYDGQKCTLELVQDATGGRAVAFGSSVLAGTDFTLPVPLSAGAGQRDFLGFFYSAGNSKYNYVSLSRGY